MTGIRAYYASPTYLKTARRVNPCTDEAFFFLVEKRPGTAANLLFERFSYPYSTAQSRDHNGSG